MGGIPRGLVVPQASGLPGGFPPAPTNPGDKFPGRDKDAYKEWMKQRLPYQTWENELHLYKRRQQSGMRANYKKNNLRFVSEKYWAHLTNTRSQQT